jgi:hypothetical protein
MFVFSVNTDNVYESSEGFEYLGNLAKALRDLSAIPTLVERENLHGFEKSRVTIGNGRESRYVDDDNPGIYIGLLGNFVAHFVANLVRAKKLGHGLIFEVKSLIIGALEQLPSLQVLHDFSRFFA